MSSEGFLKEMQTIGEKFLLKLQRLPKADPVEIVSFCVVLLFIGEFISGGKGRKEGQPSPPLRGTLCWQPNGRVCIQPGHSSLGWNSERHTCCFIVFIPIAASPQVG
uniref:Small integral membrane protein 5 n=1 Tax=Falco tinnunculus TaxID=100819 RepID=A0A8C4UVS4_FALTI